MAYAQRLSREGGSVSARDWPGMTPALIGVAVGLGLALLATRVLKALLFGVQTYDPLSFIAVAFVLSVVALVSIYVPARRAMALDPLIALRQE